MDHQTFAQLLGNYGEFFGAVAVVITLGYLAVQVRQSNQATRTNSQQAVFTNFYGLTADLVNDNETIGTIRKGFADWEGLTPDEQVTIHNYWSTLIGHLTMAYTLYREGTIDADTYSGFEENALSALQTPGLSAWWELAQLGHNRLLRERLAERLSTTATLPPVFTERFPYYKL